jgi:integrase/recombinase XerD
MFSQLFFRSDALAGQLSAPLVYERGQYLTHCTAQGMSKSTLRGKARLLILITECLRLADRPYDTISVPEIKIAATRWSRHHRRSLKAGQAKHSQQQFIAEASRWLIFLNRLYTTPPKAERACDEMLAEFRSFMRDDRGLSPVTIEYRCRIIRPFLEGCLGKSGLLNPSVSQKSIHF